MWLSLLSLVLLQVRFNPRLRDSPRVDIVAPLKGDLTFVAPNAKVRTRVPAACALHNRSRAGVVCDAHGY
jgi:hypothetical protein